MRVGKWRIDLNEHFRDADVVVLPDNDPQSKNNDGTLRYHPDGRPVFPGQDHAKDVAAKLASVARSVRVLELPDLPLKGDVSDWIDAGGTVEKLWQLVETKAIEWTEYKGPIVNGLHAPSILPPQDTRLIIRWHGDVNPNAGRAWLVKYLLPEVGTALLSGQWGTAKTFIAIDLARCTGTKETFAGHRVGRRGGTLFFAAEGASEIPLRLNGLETDGKLEALTAEGRKLPFAWVEECPPLLDLGTYAILEAKAAEASRRFNDDWGLPLATIMIDTMAAAACFKEGGENDTAANQTIMNMLAALARKLKCLVLVVDHFGKTIETGTRGSSAKEAAADVVLALFGDREQSGSVSNLRMAVRKCRGGRAGAEIPFSLREVTLGTDYDGDPVTTCVIDWSDTKTETAAPMKQAGWPKSLRTLHKSLMAVMEHACNKRPFGDDGLSVRAIDSQIVRDEYYRSYPAKGETEEQRKEAKRKAWGRNLKDAEAKDLIGIREVDRVMLIWLVERANHQPSPVRIVEAAE